MIINNSFNDTIYIDHSTIQKGDYCVINMTLFDIDYTYQNFLLDISFFIDETSETTIKNINQVLITYLINFGDFFAVTVSASDFVSVFRKLRTLNML